MNKGNWYHKKPEKCKIYKELREISNMSEKIRFYNKKTKDRKSKLPVLKTTNGIIIVVTDDEKYNALGNHFYKAVRTIMK